MSIEGRTEIQEERYAALKSQIRGTRKYCSDLITLLASGDQPASRIYLILEHCRIVTNELNAFLAVPGLTSYAAAVEASKGNLNYDLATQVNALISELSALNSAVHAAIPKDGNGYYLVLSAPGEILTERQVPPAGSAAVRAALQTVVDFIVAN